MGDVDDGIQSVAVRAPQWRHGPAVVLLSDVVRIGAVRPRLPSMARPGLGASTLVHHRPHRWQSVRRSSPQGPLFPPTFNLILMIWAVFFYLSKKKSFFCFSEQHFPVFTSKNNCSTNDNADCFVLNNRFSFLKIVRTSALVPLGLLNLSVVNEFKWN